jgi:uncharacterized protein (DUF2235 family)
MVLFTTKTSDLLLDRPYGHQVCNKQHQGQNNSKEGAMPKRIVICCDGTWNTPDQKDRGEVRPSNVAKTALSIAPLDEKGLEQLVYYDKGVGTDWYDRIRGGLTGGGISENIQQAYTYLAEQYREGDEVFLFGFSRGAYTVRSVCGLIRNCGLLKRKNIGRLDEAYNLYRRRDAKSHPTSIEAELFRRSYSREIEIRFLGVWDTVGALGIPIGHFEITNKLLDLLYGIQFHDVELSYIVKNAFQALAIDEHRAPFKPCVWKQQEHAKRLGQRLEQLWFSGVHTNIGGGYQCSGLSDCAFEWMRDRAMQCGLSFDSFALGHQHIFLTPKWDGWNGELRNSKTGVYRLFPDYLRGIGTGENANEAVHHTAVKRFNDYIDPKTNRAYQPENLATYLSKGSMVIIK